MTVKLPYRMRINTFGVFGNVVEGMRHLVFKPDQISNFFEEPGSSFISSAQGQLATLSKQEELRNDLRIKVDNKLQSAIFGSILGHIK